MYFWHCWKLIYWYYVFIFKRHASLICAELDRPRVGEEEEQVPKEKDSDIDAAERRRIRGTIQHVLHFLWNDSWTHKLICYYHWIILNRLQTDEPSKIREGFGSVPGRSGPVQQRRTAEEEWWVWDQDGVGTWSKSYFAWWRFSCFSLLFFILQIFKRISDWPSPIRVTNTIPCILLYRSYLL